MRAAPHENITDASPPPNDRQILSAASAALLRELCVLRFAKKLLNRKARKEKPLSTQRKS